jgi:putative nucleotidyltransferase with HDIG domain
MINILFVDDDPLILAGLKRLFRRYHDEWRMEFVANAQDALTQLAQRPFDVVVADMRMPGLDGGELLQRVRDTYPTVIRVILSGQSSQEAVLRTMGPAHQYLTKPCDPHVLRETLQRALALRKRLSDPKVLGIVNRIASLPPLPSVFQEVVEELNSPQASIERVGQIIARDVALTVKLMQFVNSSYFGLPQPITSPTHAAAFLGLNMVKSLVLCVGVFNQFKQESVWGFSLDQMVHHSLEVGQIARQVTQDIVGDEQIAADALLAGLLHDVGKLALATSHEIPYDTVLLLAHEKQRTLWEAEREILGVSHCEVGGYLLGLWGLPQSIVEAVALHHEPSTSGSTRFSALTAVHLANGIVHERSPKWLQGTSARIDQQYIATLDDQPRIARWIAEESRAEAEFLVADPN